MTNNSIPAANVNDLNLIDYSYRTNPAAPPPTLQNGDVLKLINSFSESGIGVPGSVTIDLLQDQTTDQLFVVSRGTNNLQNVLGDLQLANDPVSQNAINFVNSFLQSPNYQGADVEFVGHSFGGNLSLRLASDWIEWEQNTNGLTASQIADTVSVDTYNAVGLPDISVSLAQALAPVTTNYRLVIPDTEGALSNGMSAGDIVSTLLTLPGTTYEIPAMAGTYSSVADLHGASMFSSANFGDAVALPANTEGLGIEPLMDDFGSTSPLFSASQTLGVPGQVANISWLLAEQALTAFYEVREVFVAVRSRGIFGGEGKTRRPADGETETQQDKRNTYFIPIERLTREKELFARLQSLRYLFAAYFGETAVAPFTEIMTVHNGIISAASVLIQITSDDDERENGRSFRGSAEPLLNELGWGPMPRPDVADRRIEKAVHDIEKLCRPVLGRI